MRIQREFRPEFKQLSIFWIAQLSILDVLHVSGVLKKYKASLQNIERSKEGLEEEIL